MGKPQRTSVPTYDRRLYETLMILREQDSRTYYALRDHCLKQKPISNTAWLTLWSHNLLFGERVPDNIRLAVEQIRDPVPMSWAHDPPSPFDTRF